MEEVDAIVSVGLSREPPLTSWSPWKGTCSHCWKWPDA